MRKNRQKGSSLMEVIISIAVFSAIAIALGVILNLGLKSWKDVDGKTEAERDLNRAFIDMNNTIRNSIISGIICEPGSTDDPRGYIVCPSYARYTPLNENATDSATQRIMENEFDCSFDSKNDDGNITYDKLFNSNFKVVYFLHRDSNCSKCLELFDTGTANFCPHHTLVKKWFRIVKADVTPQNTVMGVPAWKDDEPWDNSASKDIARNGYDKVLAHNVLAFTAKKNTKSISYYIKIFKPNQNKARATQTELNNSIKAFYDQINNGESATQADPIKDYCLEVHSTVAPLN